MTLRCRIGDLAIYVGKHTVNLGRVVTIIAADPHYHGSWIVEPKIQSGLFPGLKARAVWDHALRPIRPEPDTAERDTDIGHEVLTSGVAHA